MDQTRTPPPPPPACAIHSATTCVENGWRALWHGCVHGWIRRRSVRSPAPDVRFPHRLYHTQLTGRYDVLTSYKYLTCIINYSRIAYCHVSCIKGVLWILARLRYILRYWKLSSGLIKVVEYCFFYELKTTNFNLLKIQNCLNWN